MKHKLTPKQRKFADEYIKSGNATESAIKAGYAKRSAQQIGTENLLKPVIKSYIDECMNQIASDKIMDASEAVELLSSIARGEATETKVVGTQYGADTVDVPPDLKTRISAIKEILKRYPDNDKLVKQKVRKLKAEADIAESKALDAGVGDENQMTAISNLMDKIQGGVENNDSETR